MHQWHDTFTKFTTLIGIGADFCWRCDNHELDWRSIMDSDGYAAVGMEIETTLNVPRNSQSICF